MENSDNKIEEYRKLIKEHGSKKASEIMREKGSLYDDDFTKNHKNDPIFSDETTEILAAETPVPLVQKILRIETEVAIPTSGGEWLIPYETKPTQNFQTPEQEIIYS